MGNIRHTCDDCGFSSTDYHLVDRHSCEVTENGGRCEDYPCCGHEAGDCNGLRYGSDEAIKAEVYRQIYLEDGYGYDDGEDY
jgi:hypothetical protein